MTADALWHLDSNRSSILPANVEAGTGEVELFALYSLISIGTERIVASGQVPFEMFDLMKVPYMEGSFSFPVLYGYSMVAQDAQDAIYHVMHPHQSRIKVKPSSLTKLPYGIPARRATLISNLETACNASWDAKLVLDDEILILGFGLIGALLAGWLSLKGFKKISILDSDPSRCKRVVELGFNLANDSKQNKYSVAFHCTATGSGLQTAISLMRMEGRIIDLSWYGDQKVELSLGNHFHYNRLTIQSSQVSHIPRYLTTVHDFSSRKQEVLSMLHHDFWDQLIDLEIPLEGAVPIFETIRKGLTLPLSIIIKY